MGVHDNRHPRRHAIKHSTGRLASRALAKLYCKIRNTQIVPICFRIDIAGDLGPDNCCLLRNQPLQCPAPRSTAVLTNKYHTAFSERPALLSIQALNSLSLSLTSSTKPKLHTTNSSPAIPSRRRDSDRSLFGITERKCGT